MNKNERGIKNKNVLRVAIMVAILGILFFVMPVSGKTGISVGPAEFRVDNVTPGQRITAGTLSVTNTGDNECTYLVSVFEPLSFREGYSSLPDYSWVSFDKTEITIPPGESGYVNVFLEVPDKKEYLNKDWEVWINVGGVKGGMITTEVFVRMLISTKAEPASFFSHIMDFVRDKARIIAVVGVIALCIGISAYVIKKKITITIRRKD